MTALVYLRLWLHYPLQLYTYKVVSTPFATPQLMFGTVTVSFLCCVYISIFHSVICWVILNVE